MMRSVVALAVFVGLLSASTFAAGESDLNAQQLAIIRAATAKYLDVEKAKADGYVQVSIFVPGSGYHFRNAGITGLDLEKPHILLYMKDGKGAWQLVGTEYGFPKGKEPPDSQVPFKGFEWDLHQAACHYKDANEIFEPNKDKCPKTHPQTGTEFAFWHPNLKTIHIWAWYPSPAGGVFKKKNPYLDAFDPKVAQASK